MIRFRVPAPILGLAVVTAFAVSPIGLQAEPHVTQPLPVLKEVAPHDRGDTRVLLAQLRDAGSPARFPHVAGETTPAAPAAPTATPTDGESSGTFGTLPMMPDPYESVLIVFAAAIAGVIGLWLGHVAGVVRLFRDDEPSPRTRA